jgi:hypothetical protein
MASAIAPTIASSATSYSQQIDTLKANATAAYLANPIVIQQAQAAATAATAEYTTANNLLQVNNISSACAITVQALSDKLDIANQNPLIANGWPKLSHTDAISYLTKAKTLKSILAEEQAKLALLNTNITTAVNTTPKTEALLATITGYTTEGQRIQARLKDQITSRFSSDLKLTSAIVTKLTTLKTYLTSVLATPPTTSTTTATTAQSIRTAAGGSNSTTTPTTTTATTPATSSTRTTTPATNITSSTASDIRNAPTAAQQSDPARTGMSIASQQSTDINGMTMTTAVRRGDGA